MKIKQRRDVAQKTSRGKFKNIARKILTTSKLRVSTQYVSPLQIETENH